MAFPQLAPSAYARDLTEAAATTLISYENLHRDQGESATAALLWAIDNGGMLTHEQALALLIDQAVNIHEGQRANLTAPEPISTINGVSTAPVGQDRAQSLTDSPLVVIADWLPTGSDEEDRILSLLSLEPF